MQIDFLQKAKEMTSGQGALPLSVYIERLTMVGFWLLLIGAGFGTYVITKNIETRAGNSAAAALSDARIYEVGLYFDHMEPSRLTISPGDEVMFVVKEDTRHNISERRRGGSGKDARIESGEFGQGESYSLTFHDEGIFDLYDRMHVDLEITIEVTNDR